MQINLSCDSSLQSHRILEQRHHENDESIRLLTGRNAEQIRNHNKNIIYENSRHECPVIRRTARHAAYAIQMNRLFCGEPTRDTEINWLLSSRVRSKSK